MEADQTASPEQRYVSTYHAAVGREHWDATYSMLDSASRSQLAKEERVRKQRARDEARDLPPVQSAKITSASGEGGVSTATVASTHQDGTITLLPDFQMTKESGELGRHLIPKELQVLKTF